MGYHLAKIYNTDWPVQKKKNNQKIQYTQWKNPENKNRLMGPKDNEM